MAEAESVRPEQIAAAFVISQLVFSYWYARRFYRHDLFGILWGGSRGFSLSWLGAMILVLISAFLMSLFESLSGVSLDPINSYFEFAIRSVFNSLNALSLAYVLFSIAMSNHEGNKFEQGWNPADLPPNGSPD